MDKNAKYKIDIEKVAIVWKEMQETDIKDNICRISIGGNKKMGYYFVFRAVSLDDIDKMMETVNKAFKTAKKLYIQQNN